MCLCMCIYLCIQRQSNGRQIKEVMIVLVVSLGGINLSVSACITLSSAESTVLVLLPSYLLSFSLVLHLIARFTYSPVLSRHFPFPLGDLCIVFIPHSFLMAYLSCSLFSPPSSLCLLSSLSLFLSLSLLISLHLSPV